MTVASNATDHNIRSDPIGASSVRKSVGSRPQRQRLV